MGQHGDPSKNQRPRRRLRRRQVRRVRLNGRERLPSHRGRARRGQRQGRGVHLQEAYQPVGVGGDVHRRRQDNQSGRRGGRRLRDVRRYQRRRRFVRANRRARRKLRRGRGLRLCQAVRRRPQQRVGGHDLADRPPRRPQRQAGRQIRLLRIDALQRRHGGCRLAAGTQRHGRGLRLSQAHRRVGGLVRPGRRAHRVRRRLQRALRALGGRQLQRKRGTRGRAGRARRAAEQPHDAPPQRRRHLSLLHRRQLHKHGVGGRSPRGARIPRRERNLQRPGRLRRRHRLGRQRLRRRRSGRLRRRRAVPRARLVGNLHLLQRLIQRGGQIRRGGGDKRR